MSSLRKYVVCLLTLWLCLAGQAWALELNRADYSLTLPDGSSIRPNTETWEDGRTMDDDHYTAVDLPNGGVLKIVVFDDKQDLQQVAPSLESVRTVYPGVKELKPSQAFVTLKGEGARFITDGGDGTGLNVFEVGLFSNKNKGYSMRLSFLEKDEKTAYPMLKNILSSFKFK